MEKNGIAALDRNGIAALDKNGLVVAEQPIEKMTMSVRHPGPILPHVIGLLQLRQATLSYLPHQRHRLLSFVVSPFAASPDRLDVGKPHVNSPSICRRDG